MVSRKRGPYTAMTTAQKVVAVTAFNQLLATNGGAAGVARALATPPTTVRKWHERARVSKDGAVQIARVYGLNMARLIRPDVEYV